MRLRRGAAIGVLAVLAAPAGAQSSRAADSARTDSARAQTPLFTGKDALIGGAFAVATVALFPLDQRLAKHLTNPGAQANNFFRRASTGVEGIASPGAYFFGGTLYVVGRVGHFQRVADLGWHGTEAVLLADAVTYSLKGITGRSRPFVTADTNPRDFKFLKGFRTGGRQSFPSGHATSAFAAAAAVTAETGRWWPRSTWVIGPLMYGGASMVALSRMYHNRHWASDVVLGAAVGTFGGQKVVQYSHDHKTALDRAVLHMSVLPDGAGNIIVAWSTTAP